MDARTEIKKELEALAELSVGKAKKVLRQWEKYKESEHLKGAVQLVDSGTMGVTDATDMLLDLA